MLINHLISFVKSAKELCEKTEMFYTLTRVVVTQVYTFVKMNSAVHLKYMHCIIRKIYLNKFGVTSVSWFLKKLKQNEGIVEKSNTLPKIQKQVQITRKKKLKME